ncbi:MAG: hypothetical protein N2039_14005, partial [Gemmataceae bacterium]|nr:hypothetical protein [Gemmataceae bacterium]
MREIRSAARSRRAWLPIPVRPALGIDQAGRVSELTGGFVMNRVIGGGIGALALLLPLTLVHWTEPRPEETDRSFIVEAVTTLFSQVESLQRQGEQIDTQLLQARQRIERKAEIARELAAGRMSLAEAEPLFRQLHAENPWVVSALRQRHPNCSPDDVHAWGAVSYTHL